MTDVLPQTGADPEHHPRPSPPAGVVAVPYPHGGRAGWRGVNLAKATDLLDERYGLGEALGGMILLSVPAAYPGAMPP
jgi:hypothetical protein